MRFDIITIFPDKVKTIFADSIVGKAQASGKVEIVVHDLRKWTDDKRKTVDDRPFGGGPGMLLMVEPIYLALKEIGVYPKRDSKTKVVLTAASGGRWQQASARQYADTIERLVIVCGNYEGVDARVAEHLVDGQISIGDYVLTGGELAAGVIVDSITRLLPGVLGNTESLAEETHSNDVSSEYPQYTRPATFTTAEGETWNVPEILMSGDHARVRAWQRENTIRTG